MFAVSARGFATFDRRIIKTNWRRIAESPAKRSGLLIRKIAKRSIRRDKSKHGNRPSKAGKPPRTRAPGDPLRRIYSVPELMGARTIIGPLGFGGANPITELHEFSGFASRLVFEDAGGGAGGRDRHGRFKKKRRFGARRVRKTVRYPKRAYMRPALAKALPKLPPMWRGSLN